MQYYGQFCIMLQCNNLQIQFRELWLGLIVRQNPVSGAAGGGESSNSRLDRFRGATNRFNNFVTVRYQ